MVASRIAASDKIEKGVSQKSCGVKFLELLVLEPEGGARLL
jgi:hypothetical protein